MLVHGVRGIDPRVRVQEEPIMSEAELEVHGVDWEALHDDALLESRQENNPADEGSTSWIGRTGRRPNSTRRVGNCTWALGRAVDDAEVANLWTEALIVARQMHPELF
ncbi:hypothetical protein B0H19DRAFT_1077691 [Mycena capillaripes]|nr:hypothetical protein B0H19DRAFT_1077691 [Mycena capillaripes]